MAIIVTCPLADAFYVLPVTGNVSRDAVYVVLVTGNVLLVASLVKEVGPSCRYVPQSS